MIINFKPYETESLLNYIYFPRKFQSFNCVNTDLKANQLLLGLQSDLDPEADRQATDSKSYLEFCVRLWAMAEEYQFEPMSLQILDLLEQRCKKLCNEITTSKPTEERLAAIHQDLEPAIRQAWDKRVTSMPLRDALMQPVLAMASYLGNQESFARLITEMADFAVDFCKATVKFFASSPEDQATHMLRTSVKQCTALEKYEKPTAAVDKIPASSTTFRAHPVSDQGFGLFGVPVTTTTPANTANVSTVKTGNLFVFSTDYASTPSAAVYNPFSSLAKKLESTSTPTASAGFGHSTMSNPTTAKPCYSASSGLFGSRKMTEGTSIFSPAARSGDQVFKTAELKPTIVSAFGGWNTSYPKDLGLPFAPPVIEESKSSREQATFMNISALAHMRDFSVEEHRLSSYIQSGRFL